MDRNFNEYIVFSVKDRNVLFFPEDNDYYSITREQLIKLGSYEESIHNKKNDDVINKIFKYKKLCSNERCKSNKYTKKNHAITSIELHVSHMCNLACTYCYATQGNYGGSISLMAPDIARDSVDFLVKNSHDANQLHVVFFGGEPLLNLPTIESTIEYCKKIECRTKKRFTFAITTNGLLLNQKVRKLFVDNNVAVTVSVDGDKKSHDKNRPTKSGKPTYDKIMNNVNMLQHEGGRVCLRATYVPDGDVFGYYNNIDNDKNCSIHVALVDTATPDEYENLTNDIRNNLDAIVNSIRIKNEYKISIFDDVIKRLSNGSEHNICCGAGYSFVSISPEGNLFPCHRFMNVNEFSMGTIKNERASDDFKFMPYVDEIKECRKCWVRNICSGHCHHERYINAGSVSDVYESFCDFYRELVKYAIYLLLKKEERIVFG